MRLVKLILGLGLWLSSSAWAATGATVIFPVQATNLTDTQAEAVGTVFVQQYIQVLGRDVIGPARARQALSSDTDYAAAAKSLGAHEYVEVSAVALDTKILVSAARHDQSGELVSSAQMTALSLDDIVEVGNRLAHALIEKKSVDQTLSLDNVTNADNKGRNHVRSHKTFGVKTAVAFPVFAGNFNPMLNVGFDGRFESKRYFLEFGAGATLPSDRSASRKSYGGIYADLGASYYLVDGSIAPYIGGGVLPRIIGGDVSGVGIAPYAQLGVVFMRESSTRFYTDVRVAQNVLPLRHDETSYDHDNYSTTRKYYYPTEVMWEVGIGW